MIMCFSAGPALLVNIAGKSIVVAAAPTGGLRQVLLLLELLAGMSACTRDNVL
jgi:hypothetical protein